MLNNKILKNKNCFISGATGGIGKEIAKKMAENKCNLFLTSTNMSKLNKLRTQLENINPGIKVFYEAGDFNKDTEGIINKANRAFKGIDILINCAGVFPNKSLQDSKLEDFDNCFNINVKAPFLFSKSFSKYMIKKKWGRIVNIGSSSAYSGFKNTSLYCASKHALLGFSRSWYNELKKFNVRTFCISPSTVNTKMGRSIKNQNFNTFINPKTLAEYVAFLISFNDESISEEIRISRVMSE